MELFSNHSLFERWRKLIEDRIKDKNLRLRRCLPEKDQVFYASWSGDQNCVKKLLDARATGDTTAWRLGPALHIASKFGHLETVALLIREGANVNAAVERRNILYTAVKAGQMDIIALLIKEGADVNAQEGRYGNVLEVASRSGRMDIVELLIRQGADVNVHSTYTNALCTASYYGHLNIVMHLVEEGADVNAEVYYDTPLCAASRSGHLNIVAYLVEKGADVNAPRGGFENALRAAITFQRDSVVKFLQNHKADLRHQ
ncbi:putative ankyrin repeat protein L25 [Fusarium oxysporum f. sp. cubense]|uniref:Putative ankyrin repeat protein L25 n=1 Tax=Fusarium oxysporum f. sp. cubense TaxID=61366 RepID=A0A559KQ09_FUSOC|nr:putative ankyrin repeat protein L25 [Fusarium oxysporum f. sp. cubense]